MLGQLLITRGVLSADEISDVLAAQEQRFPLASLCYVMGHAGERALAQVLAEHTGVAAVILDESVIHLPVLGGLEQAWARAHRALPIFEDETRLVVAVSDAEGAGPIAAAAVAAGRGLTLEIVVALDVTLTRTIRRAFAARDRGDAYWIGIDAVADPDATRGFAVVVVPMVVDEGAGSTAAPEAVLDESTDPHATPILDASAGEVVSARRAVTEDATRQGLSFDMLLDQAAQVDRGGTDWVGAGTMAAAFGDSGTSLDAQTRFLVRELEAGRPARRAEGVQMPAVLIVDTDGPASALAQRELARLGYVVEVAASGARAVSALQTQTFALVLIDVGTPALDGWRLARAIKSALRLIGTRVVLVASLVDAGPMQVDEVARAQADGYLEKPYDRMRLQRVVRELVGGGVSSHHAAAAFAEAMEALAAGEIDHAIRRLRAAIADDPGAARPRYVLGGLLQRQGHAAEAVDEYEVVVALEPAFFPALTRLAYLHYEQGHLARAVETWRRALPVCEDPTMREHIEVLMRQLVAELTGAPIPAS
jgi:CheY-like chemotaxis protein